MSFHDYLFAEATISSLLYGSLIILNGTDCALVGIMHNCFIFTKFIHIILRILSPLSISTFSVGHELCSFMIDGAHSWIIYYCNEGLSFVKETAVCGKWLLEYFSTNNFEVVVIPLPTISS